MLKEQQSSCQNMVQRLWDNEIHYDKMLVSLAEFSVFLEQRAKKSAADFLNIGIKKQIGWLIAGTDYLEVEMRNVCNDISSYITQNNILSAPNWNMFLEPWIAIADSSKQLTLSLHNTLIADCTNEVREQADRAYRNSLANSEGLGFGIISSSLTAHFIYAVQAASKEAENKRKAQYASDAVWRNGSPMEKADELTTKAYHETHEPFVLDTLANFYTSIESFIYTGVGFDKKVVDESIKQSVNILGDSDQEPRIKIIQSLQANICCGEAVLYAIENGHVDDNFITFCRCAPIMLLVKSVKPIVGWLNDIKRTNLLYNRPVFCEKTLRFLSVVRSIFLDGTDVKYELYDNILNGAFANEITSIETGLYDLCYFNNGVLRKYANSGTHISVDGYIITLLITLCNEIQSGKIINMVKSAGLTLPIEAVQLKTLITSKNSAIDKRHAEILQAKHEADEREAIAKAEREHIEAERLAKRRAEEEARHKETIRKSKMIATILTPVIAIILAFALWLWPDVLQPSIKYHSAVTLLEQEKYSDAVVILSTLTDYKDSNNLLMMAKYRNGQQLMQEANYSEAISQFSELGVYKESETLILEAKYQMALEALSSGNDAEAVKLFADIRHYSDSEEYLSEYQFILTLMEDYLPNYGTYSEKYNDKGLLVSRTDRSGTMYSYEYDDCDHLISINDSDGSTAYTFDAAGNLLSEETIDKLIEYFYNEDNQLICKRRTSHTYVLGLKCSEVYWVTFFEYAANGNLTYEYEWFKSGYNPLRISLTEYEYDVDGNCISTTEYLYGENIWIHYIENKPYLDEEIKSQLQAMSNTLQSQIQYTYIDGLLMEENHFSKFSNNEMITTKHITYQYKDGLLIQKVNHISDDIYTYYHDTLGNLIRVEGNDGGWTTYTYKPVFSGDRP